MAAAARKCNGKRYLAGIGVSAGFLVPTNPQGSGQLYSDCLDDAKCAIERTVAQHQASLTVGYTAFIIDLEAKKIVALASSPKKPILQWSDETDEPTVA